MSRNRLALEQELAEAKSVLAAIGNGDADAIVIQTAAGPKVYTLRGADEPYRTIVENLKEGAVTIDDSGVTLYCNEAFGRLVGRDCSSFLGSHFGAIVDGDVMATLTAAGGSPGSECVLRHVDGRRLHCQVSSVPHASDNGTIYCLLVTDLTGQGLRLRYNAIIESTDDAVISFDVDGRITSWNPAAVALFGYTAAEAIGRDADLLVTPLDGVLPGETARGAFDHALSGQSFQKESRRVAKDGTVIDVWVTASPIRTADGRITGVSAIMRDIRARKLADERERLLMHEVNHRSKNMLSLVQAIARQTAASSPTAFVERFGQRIQALSAGQDVLVKSGWKSVPIDALVRAHLGHFADALGHRIKLHGANLTITPEAAQAIGLALHELATNAAKYGALSNDLGRVAVDWGLTANGATKPLFKMSWTETGGPAVTKPERRGFGSTVIVALTKMSLDGEVDLDYHASGLSWRLTCPSGKVLEGAPASAAPTEHPAHPNTTARAKRVLVVEDEALLAVEVAAMLSESGYEVLGPVSSVKQALRLIELKGCEAAVLDVNLGAETAEPIAHHLRNLGTPFVTISGYAREQMPPAFKEAPLIGKPVQPRRLIAELQKCLKS